MFWNQYPHPGILRKFAREEAAVSCRYSPGIRSPLGVTPERGGAARRLCRSQAGGGALAAVCLGGRGAGVVSPGRRGQGAVPGGAAGASGARGAGAFLPGGGAGKTAAPSAACVGFQATSAIEAAGGRKSPFLPYKEALFFRARLLLNQSCFAPKSLSLRSGCFFGGAE